MVALPCLLCVLLFWTRIEENCGKCPRSSGSSQRVSGRSCYLECHFPSFVQEARRNGLCVTKMAQGRRPAFCCLSEECLLSGAGGNRRGAGTEKSGALREPKGRNSNKPARCFCRSDPHRPRASRQGETHKLAASPTGSGLLFNYLVPRSCARPRSWTSFLCDFLPPSRVSVAALARASLCCRVTVISVHFVWLSSVPRL